MGERKYRQRGYMEEEPREGRRGAAPSRREGPRGRGLGAPRAESFQCARCGAKADVGDDVALDAVCRTCGEDLRSCVNCGQFDTSAPNECRAGVEERVSSKAKRNQCEKFEPKVVQGFASDSGRDDPKKAFDELFDF